MRWPRGLQDDQHGEGKGTNTTTKRVINVTVIPVSDSDYAEKGPALQALGGRTRMCPVIEHMNFSQHLSNSNTGRPKLPCLGYLSH